MTRTEWLAWRKKGIGSSDAAVLHGFHEYLTPLTLYEDKIDPNVKDERPNFIQEKGQRLEVIARAKMNEVLSNAYFETVILEPKTFVLADLEYLRCSLDGFASPRNKRVGIEVKYCGKEFRETAPEHHAVQMQHQFLVAQLDEQYYVQINDAEEIKFTKWNRDPAFVPAHLRICGEFWKRVLEKNPPDLVDADWKKVRISSKVTERWAVAKAKIKEYERELKTIEKELIDLAKGHPRIIANDIKFFEIERSGSVDYSKIPELKSVDLEKYRKPSTKYWKFSNGTTEV